MHRPGQMQGKGDLEPEAGVGTSMLTMGSVPLGLEVPQILQEVLGH